MTFHPHQKAPLAINFTYNNTKLEVVDTFTLLGINIDTHINWKPHIENIRSKLSKFAYALREIKKTTDIKTALVTYYAYAYAWLSYGVMLWGNSTDASSLFTAQKKLVRTIVNIDQTDSCKPFFFKLKLLTLPCIYILEICKFVRAHEKYFKKQSDRNIGRSLRNENRLLLPTSRLALHSNSPFVMCTKLYNKLPDSIKKEQKNKHFLRKLKNILLKKCYYSIKEYLEDKNIGGI